MVDASEENPATNSEQGGEVVRRRSSFLTSSDGAPTLRRRSSFLTRARESYVRRKNKGMDAEALRGTSGADFEGYAKVIRGGGGVPGLGCSCNCFGGDSETRKIRYLLIKGASCFIFQNEGAPAPKYAISLAHMKAEMEPQSHGSTTVYLKTSLGDIEYTMIFDTQTSNEVATTFRDVVNEMSKKAQTEEVKKRLGHGHLLSKRASTQFADSVAKEKVKDQPEAPVTAAEMIDIMPDARY